MKRRDLGSELCLAVFRGKPESVRQLITEGADVNSIAGKRIASVTENTPLWTAVQHASNEITEEWKIFHAVLDDPRRPQKDHRKVYLEIVKILLQAGANVNQYCHGSPPLCQAIQRGDIEIVNLLISAGANVNAETYSIFSKLAKKERRKTEPGYYETLLHQAVQVGTISVVEALVAAGANTTPKDHKGKTPLDLARKKKREDIATLLRAQPKK